MRRKTDADGKVLTRKTERAALITWAVLVLVLSVSNFAGSSPNVGFTIPDTVMHAVFYMPLAALFAANLSSPKSWKRWLYAALLAFGFGVFMELVQWALPWRSFEIKDMAANLFGAVVGSSFGLIVFSRE